MAGHKLCDKRCAGCYYSFTTSCGIACDWIGYHDGQRRPCPAGADCTEYVPLKKSFSARANRRLDADRALALYRQGKTDAEIATELGVVRHTVAKWRQNMKLPSHQKTGSQGNYKLDTAKALALNEEGYSDLFIAKELGVTEYTVIRWRQKNDIPSATERKYQNQ